MKRDRKPPILTSVAPAWALECKTTPQHQRVASRQASSLSELVSPNLALLRVEEAAAVLQVSSKTVRRLLTHGHLKAIRIGRSVRIRFSELERLIATGCPSGGNFGDGGHHD